MDSFNSNDQRAWRALDKVLQASLIEQRRARRWGIFFKLLTFGYVLVAFLLLAPKGLPPAPSGSGHTAVVRVEGLIADGERAAANHIIAGLQRAFEHSNTRAVLLLINSPGGSPVQADYIYNEMLRLQAMHPDTPLYAVISDMGASGAYYLAAAANRIYAAPSSLVGSIGVVSGSFGFVQALEKLGVERRLFTAGDHKGLLDPFSPLEDSEVEFWQQVLERTHQQFISRVRDGRGTRLKDDPDLFSGLVWSGEQALELGLIDGLASAGQVARDVVGVEAIVDFTVRPAPLERLTGILGTAVGRSLAQALQFSSTTPLR